MKTEALVIYSFPFKDNKSMVELLTREAGRVSLAVQSGAARSRRSGAGGASRALLQPLTLLSIEFDEHRKRLLHAAIVFPYRTLLTDAYKLSIAFFVAEFLRYATRKEPCNTGLFDYVAQSLQWLDAAEGGFANYHIVFLLRLSRFLGLYPNVEEYRRGDCFDLREGAFRSVHPMHGDVIGGVEAERIATLMRMNYSNMHLFRMTRDDRNLILTRIIHFYRLHIPDFPEMKSLEVLRELF